MWLAVASPTAKQALQLMEEFWERGLDEAARFSAAAVIDLDADTRTCPACMTSFAAGPQKCPECGLFIGG